MAKAKKAIKQTNFVYQGTDKKGRKVKGELEAPNQAFVKATLRRQGVTPGKVKRAPKPLFARAKRITTKDIALASRQMATMIQAGIPVAQCIGGISRGHENPSMQTLFTTLRQEVEAGTSLSNSLAKHPKYFDKLFINLVEAGEQSGTLDRLLDRIAVYLEKIEAIKSKIKSAMFYPIAVLVVAIVVVTVLLIFVIPQFESLFIGFGGELPSLTKFVVEMSRFMQANWYIVFGIAFAVFITLRKIIKGSEKVRYFLDKMKLKMPVFGSVMVKSTIARFARTLSTMFSAGVPLVDALDSVGGACGNLVYEKAILEIKNEVSGGRGLEPTMAESGLFPSMVLQMVGSGEEAGELETMLDKIADFYEREVDDAVAAMSSLLEPIMIVILGGLVGTVVVAMYLPVFKMGSVI